MPNSQTASASRPLWLRLLLKAVSVLATMLIVGVLLSLTLRKLNTFDGAAGFPRGLVHGVLMPMSFPNLIVGDDVTIYATNNTGLSYKLGYSLGVNVCGVFFFGSLYLRLKRLRRELSQLKR